mmetsp:Transcript_9178/g.11947  ORF Transcript_9178/g.11947 Transcript_9178/m.11947 type:complete len:331 (-) Transcript_9178:461-1453(-)
MLGQVDSVCFGPDAKSALVGVSILHGNTWQGEIRLAHFSQQNDEIIPTNETGPGYFMPCGVSEVDWITPGLTLAAAADDFDIHILSLEPMTTPTGEELVEFCLQSKLSDHDDAVTSVHSIRTHLVSGSFDGTVKTWDVKNLTVPLSTVSVRDGIVWDVKFVNKQSADTILTASQGGGLQLWDLRDSFAKCVSQINKPGTGIASNSVSVSQGNSILFGCGKEDGSVSCYDSRNTSQPMFLKEKLHAAAVHKVTFNPEGTRLASGGDDTRLYVTSVAAENESVPIGTGHSDYIRGLCWKPKLTLDVINDNEAPRLEHILSGSWDKTIRVTKV